MGAAASCNGETAATAAAPRLGFGDVVANDVESAVRIRSTGCPPRCVVVLDNKAHKDPEECPRLAVVEGDGVATPVTGGTASVVRANDLESISLVDAETGTYAAVESQCRVHVFTLSKSDGAFVADQVATGALPAPDGEDTDNWKDPHPANVEAARVFRDARGDLACLWGARGGFNYAGSNAPSDEVWLRYAPFDARRGTADARSVVSATLKNLGASGSWRALTCLDVDASGRIYFAACYDGEEDGHPRHKADRDHFKNRRAFRSLVASVSTPATVDAKTGDARILGRFSGIKIEALWRDENGRFTLVTDDEDLGSLIATVDLDENGVFPREVDFFGIAAAARGGVAARHWGCSGVAPLACA